MADTSWFWQIAARAIKNPKISLFCRPKVTLGKKQGHGQSYPSSDIRYFSWHEQSIYYCKKMPTSLSLDLWTCAVETNCSKHYLLAWGFLLYPFQVTNFRTRSTKWIIIRNRQIFLLIFISFYCFLIMWSSSRNNIATLWGGRKEGKGSRQGQHTNTCFQQLTVQSLRTSKHPISLKIVKIQTIHTLWLKTISLQALPQGGKKNKQHK